MKKSLLTIFVYLIIYSCYAQVTLTGSVKDSKTGEELIGVTLMIKGTTLGASSDLNGNFKINSSTNFPTPLILLVSYVGYQKQEIKVPDATKKINIRLVSETVNLDEANVVGERIKEKQKLSPLTVESMDIIAIKETPAANFYDGLGQLKGVDITAASIGFKVINTRGFNSTAPVRSLQIIDGVDNQSPGLNFSLGNFLGASELDVQSVDLIVGASSAYYGPNAFNGVISMNTKSPFTTTGLSVLTKTGERGLFETAIRYAEKFKNKKGEEKFAFKLNAFYMRANDWEAVNYDATPQSPSPRGNPGGYDAVNRYGDEYIGQLQNYSGAGDRRLVPGLGIYYRTGYLEKDLVDYNSRNVKLGAAFHYKIKPDVQLILSSNYGNGTTVFQGENRFSLKDIKFYQNRLELKKENKYFVQAYATNEDAGNSYDAVFTALLMQDLAKSFDQWALGYYAYWASNVVPKVKALPGYPPNPVWPNPFNQAKADSVVGANGDKIENWHKDAAEFANKKIPTSPGSYDYFQPGTREFDSVFTVVTGNLSSFEKGKFGSRFYDKSALYHTRGEYKFTPKFADIITGGNYRLYVPNSKGTIFMDTNGRRIYNSEFGFYAGIEKKLLEEKIRINITSRMDKNQNFGYLFSPAASIVYKPDDNNYFRFSFSSAIRNPTLLDQYLNYNVGRAKLVGNTEGFDSLVTIPSLIKALDNQTQDSLVFFNVDPVRPEKVKTLEIGYRGTLFNKVYVDASYYYSIYRDFIGFKIGAYPEFNSFNLLTSNQVYRVSTNSKELVTTQGFAANFIYNFKKNLAITGNYSWNVLNQKKEIDSIIPAFNTPAHKFNIGISGRNMEGYLFKKISLQGWGFNINYKWVQGFQFEGSPQFTGFVPTYNVLDAQINYKYDKWKSTFKLGCSNILNKQYFQVYGGPFMGRMAYFSLLIDLVKD